MNRLAVSLFLLGLAALPFNVKGSSVVQTNVGVVSASQQSNLQRAALTQVIVKMTGLQESTENAQVREALRDASSYLSSYEFFTRNGQSYYRGEFDRPKLQQLLRRANLPIWAARRPDAIFWVAAQEQEEIRILSDVDVQNRSTNLLTQASERGLSVLLPLLDLDDSINVAPVDVWGRFMPTLSVASDRYGTEYIVVARILSTDLLRQGQTLANRILSTSHSTQVQSRSFRDSSAYSYSVSSIDDFLAWKEKQSVVSANSFQVNEFSDISDDVTRYNYVMDWTIQGDNYIESGQFFADSENELHIKLVDYYADTLGARYAISPNQGDAGVVNLSIANIQSLNSVVALTRYLTDLTVVQSVQLESMQGTVGLFKVDLIGNMIDLESTLLLDEKLVSVDVEFSDLSDPRLSHFFWNP